MKTPQDPHVIGIGTAVPSGFLTARGYAELASRICARIPREAALIHTVARQSGIEKRHSVIVESPGPLDDKPVPLYENRPSDSPWPTTAERMKLYAEHAPPLAAEAARAALTEAGVSPTAITHLITASCTGLFSPGIDAHLIKTLGLSPGISRTNIGFMGCHAAVNALATARAFALADPNAVVLALCLELCTLHFQKGVGRDTLVPNSLFADGAAAFVVADQNAQPSGLRFNGTASHLVPQSAGAMTWTITDTGFCMTLDSTVPDLVREHVRPFVEQSLAKYALQIGDIAGWAIHPGGPRVIEYVLRALGLPPAAGDHSRAILQQYGNMSSPTVLFILERIRAAAVRGPIVLLAFGPGLVAELAVAELY